MDQPGSTEATDRVRCRYGDHALHLASRIVRLRLSRSLQTQPQFHTSIKNSLGELPMSQTLDVVRLDLPHLLWPLPGPRAQALMERDARVVSPSYTRGYPLAVERGAGCIIEDVDGNRFLDFNAGIAVVATGHCHPRVVEAVQRQAARLIHMSCTDFYYEGMVLLAKKLAALAPGGVPRRVSFGNSGAEAMEGAIKLARYATGRDKIIAFYGSFHGRTMGALSLTARKAVQREGFGPF